MTCSGKTFAKSRVAAGVLTALLTCHASVAFEVPSLEQLRGPTFDGLTTSEKELLLEFAVSIQSLTDRYTSVQMNAVSTFAERSDSGNDDLIPEAAISTEVLRLETDFYRALVRPVDQEKASSARMLLVDERNRWWLRSDPETDKFFVVEHGRETDSVQGARFPQWWIDAAFAFRITRVDKELLHDHPYSRLSSVRAVVDHEGYRLIEIAGQRLPRPDLKSDGDDRHDTPEQVLRFYRDHFCALKEGQQSGYGVGTTTQSRQQQRCTYKFAAGEFPMLQSVQLTVEHRDLADAGDDTLWRLERQQDVVVTRLEFAPPDESEFRIQKFIPDYGRVTPSPSTTSKWIFLANAVVFLTLWFLIRRRIKNRTPLA